MKVLVGINGRVIDVVEAEFPVPEGLKWQDAPPGVGIGWEYRDGAYVAPAQAEAPAAVRGLGLQARLDALEAALKRKGVLSPADLDTAP